MNGESGGGPRKLTGENEEDRRRLRTGVNVEGDHQDESERKRVEGSKRVCSAGMDC